MNDRTFFQNPHKRGKSAPNRPPTTATCLPALAYKQVSFHWYLCLNLGTNGLASAASRSSLLTFPGANTEQAEESLPKAGAEHEEADEVDGAAEQGQGEGGGSHDVVEVPVLLTPAVAQAGVLEDVVEGVRQRQDQVRDGGGQDGQCHLPLPLSARHLVGRGLHVLRLQVMTSQGPHGGDVGGQQGQERNVGQEDGGRCTEAVGDIGVGFVGVCVVQ